MAHYTNISLQEMTEFLTKQGFLVLKLEGVKETVFGKLVYPPNELKPFSLRVYTGIEGTDSRGVGKDAIRVALFFRKLDMSIGMLGGDKRVHRVEGWKNNLQSRIDNWKDHLPTHRCPKCDSYLMERTAKATKNKFLGCVQYPLCKHTQNISQTP